MTKCRLCASTRERKRTSSIGEKTLNGECGPVNSHPPSRVPALALMNHLADRGEGLISQRALLKALATAHYLESHARRVYRSADEAELAAAKAILKHIKSGDLKDGFTARDVHQHGWAHLSEREQVGAGLGLLADLDYLAALAPATGAQGGRPKVTYRMNPRIAP
jgi:hypothetical protein